MFYLRKDARFQGLDDEGLAVYGISKPKPARRPRFRLDPAKIAKAQADRESVLALLGELG